MERLKKEEAEKKMNDRQKLILSSFLWGIITGVSFTSIYWYFIYN